MGNRLLLDNYLPTTVSALFSPAALSIPSKHVAMTPFFFLSFICFLLSSLSVASDYHERLDLQPLPQSALLASFNFRSNTSQEAFDQRHFRYLPRALGQILQHAHTKELHLRFTTGRWDAESWGSRPWNGAKEGGTGVELWAWIDAVNDERYVERGALVWYR